MGAAPEQLSPAPLTWRDSLRPALIGWLAARAAVAIGVLVAHVLARHVELPDGRLHLDQGLMTWDGTYYRVIAEGWYGGSSTPEDAVRFFPLYPALARALDPLLPGGVDVPLLLLANAAALGAAVLLHRLTVEVIGGRAIADRAAWMVALIPAANVAAFGYSEGPALLLVVTFLLALHRRATGEAGALGLLAGLLRPVGVLLAAPAAIEAWQSWRRGRRLGWIAAVLAPLVGLLTALLLVRQGDADLLEPFRIQRSLRDGFRDPFTRIVEAVIDVASGRMHDVYNLVFALGFLALIVVAIRRRQPLSWITLMVLTWVVAVGGNNMDSVGRYCLVAAPFAVALAQWSERRWQQAAVAVVGLVGTAWFTTEVLLGRIIP